MFSPLSLFSAGQAGAWYEPYNVGSLFQDSGLTTPVTAASDPVGGIKDLSGNGLHAVQTDNGRRPTYAEGSGMRWLDMDPVSASALSVTSWPFAQYPYLAIAFTVDSSPVPFSHIIETRGNSTPSSQQRQPLLFYRQSASDIASSFMGQTYGEAFTLGDVVVVQTWALSNGNLGYAVNGVETEQSATIALTDGSPNETMNIGPAATGPAWDGKFYGMIRLGYTPTQRQRQQINNYLAGKAGL